MKKILWIVGAVFLGGAVAVGLQQLLPKAQPTIIVTNDSPTTIPVNNQPMALPDLSHAAELTVDAVVHVRSMYAGEPYYSSWQDLFFGTPQNGRRSTSSGSGVILSSDGYIVTNNHVIEGAEEIQITLNDNKAFMAKVIGADPTTDIALLKVEADDLPFIQFSNSDRVRVGEWVLAVGNPFNLTSTVTAGIVSAKGRSINIINKQSAIESFIQTDAAVNPGNSGGALVNTRGELVGINTAISTHTGSYEGYSFAVPANMVKKVVDDLMEYGVVQRAFIGVNIANLNAQLIEAEDLKVSEGVYIAGVNPGGAADEAGIEAGDVVIAVDGNPVSKAAELQEQIGRKRPGDQAAIKVMRDGKERTFTLTLKNKNNTTALVKPGTANLVEMLGASFQSVNPDDLARLGIGNGVQIADLGPGKLMRSGIRKGFIITKIDNKSIKTVDDIIGTLKDKEGGVFIEGIYPNGAKSYYAFGM